MRKHPWLLLLLVPAGALAVWVVTRGGSPSAVEVGLESMNARPAEVDESTPEPADTSGGSGRPVDARAEPDRVQHPPESMSFVVGRIEHSVTGTPVAGVSVALRPDPPPLVERPLAADLSWPAHHADPVFAPAGASVTPTDAEGRYRIEGRTCEGYVTVLDPHLTPVAPVFLDGSRVHEAPVIRVRPAGVVEGRVTDAAGAGLPDVVVEIETSVDMMFAFSSRPLHHAARTKTDGAGRFRVPSVPADVDFTIVAKPPRRLSVFHGIRVAAARTVTVDLVSAEGVAVSGAVVGNGTPVAGAEVILRPSELRFDGARMNRLATSDVRATTGPDGRFVAGGLEPGEYNLRAGAPGFAEARRSRVVVPDGGLDLAEPIELGAGASISGRVVDDLGGAVPHAEVGFFRGSFFGVGGLTLEPDAADELGGFRTRCDEAGRFASPLLPPGEFDVTATSPDHAIGSRSRVAVGSDDVEVVLERRGAIEGIVLSLVDGEPLSRFSIAATTPFDLSSMMQAKAFIPPRSKTVLAEDGTFRLDRITPGTYTVEVLAEEHARGVRPDIEVKSGETTRGVIFMLPPESAIRGRVVAADTGMPIPGARVSSRSGLARLKPDPLSTTSAARADAQGSFELAQLPGGRYTLTADAEGYATGASAPITLIDQQRLEDVVIALSPGATIRGSVRDVDGTAVEGAMLVAKRPTGFEFAMATTDAAGEYAITGLGAGSYVVTKMNQLGFDLDDPLGSMLDGIENRNVRLDPGATVVLDFLATSTEGGVHLFGEVREGNAPLGGAILTFTPDDDGSDDLLGRIRMATANAAGEYEIDGLAPGLWSVTVQLVSSFSDATRQSFAFAIPEQLEEFEKDFEIRATGIAGRVAARDTGRPIGGARVSVDALDEGVKVDVMYEAAGARRMAEVFADSDGRYRVRGLPAGSYHVVAGGPAFFGIGGGTYARSEPRLVSIRDDANADGVDFELDPGGSVAGMVTRRDGEKVDGASIFFLGAGDAARSPFGEIFSDESGRFRADGLQTGTYTIVAKADGLAPGYVTGVPVRANEETERDLILEPGAPLSLEVVGASGEPIIGANVALFDGSGLELSAFITIDEIFGKASTKSGPGVYPLGPVAAGFYTARVSAGGASVTVEVSHGSQPTTTTVVLK